MENPLLTTKEASERCKGVISSRDFARLAKRGKLPGAEKVERNWLIPIEAVDDYVIKVKDATTISKRVIQWWDRTSRFSAVALIILSLTFLANSIDFFVNIYSLFDIISPGTTLFVDKAKDDEILILVAEFSGHGDYDPTTRVYRSLDEAIKREGLDNRGPLKVEVRRVPNMPQIQEDAIKLGSRYNASIVIWGTYDQAAIEPIVEVLKAPIESADFPQPGLTINQDQQAYNLYLASGLPDDMEFLSFLVIAKSYMYLSEYEQAINVLTTMLTYELGERAAKLDISYVYALRANAYQYLNSFQDAETDYLAAIEANPSDPIAYVNLAVVKFQMGNYLEAIEFSDQALNVLRGSQYEWALHFTKGGSYHVLGEYESAIDEYSVAFDLCEEEDFLRAIILMSRGTSYSAIQSWIEARDDYRVSNELFPKYPSLYHNWGDMELTAGDPQTALEYFNLALEYGSTDPRTTQLRGVAYRDLMDYEKAREDFNYVISIAPDYGGGYFDRGVLERLEGNYESALTDLEKAQEIWPDNASVYQELLIIQAHYGDWNKLIEILSRLHELEEGNIDWLLLRADIYLNVSDFARAKTDYLEAQSIEPTNQRVLYGLGVVSLFYDDDVTGAVELFDEAIAIDSQIQDVYLMRSIAYGFQENYDAASKDCSRYNQMRSTNTGTRMGTFDKCIVFTKDSAVIVSVLYDDGTEVYYSSREVSLP